MEVIRFHCPACSIALTVPPEAAGFQGPCPKCSVEIIGPNPALGQAARLPVVEPPAVEDQTPSELIPPTEPFAGTTQVPEKVQTPLPEPPSQPAESPNGEVVEKADEAEGAVGPRDSDLLSDEDSHPPRKSRSARSTATVVLLSCLLCAALAYVAGLSSGGDEPDKGTPDNSSEQVEPPSPTLEPEPTTVPDPTPVEAAIPEELAPVEQSKKIAGPEATLKAFLNADGWAERSSYVMFPERVRPLMETHSKTNSDGPIPTTKVSLFEVAEQAHIFRVTTPEAPEGFPVAVARNNNGWLVDWETFIEFHDDRFARFVRGEGGDRGEFHLLVKPAEPDESASFFERFLLNPPMPGHEQSAYVKKGSVPLARIQGVFDRKAGFSDEVFSKLLEGQGPPMILALSYKTNSAGQSYLQIDDVVAIGWEPREP
ncbi:hypothetical protein [Haloferula sp.]|uniref:hypothetical protein n=1 Tax=Haloferula sp. TaxID=2497595 RepID=UPI00329B7ED0